MIVIGSEMIFTEVLVVGVTKCLGAAVSIKAVDDKSGGLAQQESR
jgi:hypothetical protein